MSTFAAVIGRILLSLIFIISGIGKLIDPAGTAAMMNGAGLPGGLAYVVAAFELVLGLCLAFGIMTRIAALLLFGFTALTILFFHNRFTDPMQAAMAMKNLAIMGGLLLVFAHSQMWWSWDRMRRERRGEIATAHAVERAHEAELRAVRAEAAASAAHHEGATVVTDIDRDGVPEVRKRRWW